MDDNNNKVVVETVVEETDNDNKVVAETVVEETEDNNNDGDDGVDYKTITEEDNDNNKEEKEKWYYKAKFMLDWVNKFSRMYCVHPGFAISIDEMMKLFKERSNMTHRMKKTPTKEGFKFYAMVYSYSG